MIRGARFLPWLLLALAAAPSTGHRLDEYLQAMLVAIEPSGLQLQINLTPGVEIADQVLTRIDRDGDDAISPDEAKAYAELLKRDLTVLLDKDHLELKLTGCEIPTPSELRSGWQIIQVEFTAIRDFDAGPHKLIVKNSHLPTTSVYLFNAAKSRSGSVQILRQKRNHDQSAGEIEFNLTSSSNGSPRTITTPP